MGAMQRRKGANGEREFCRDFGALVGLELARNLLQTREGGAGGDVTGCGLWAIEVKRAAEPRIPDWWQQAVDQATGGAWPALAYRLDRRQWRVVVQLRAVAVGNKTWDGCVDADLTYCAEISLTAFAALVRESL